MSLSKSLQKRSNGVYYLRVFIPTALIPQFGRKEITRSLGTTCHSHAERLAITMRSRIYGLINMAENNPQLGKDELRQMAQRHYDRMVEESEITVLKTKFKRMGKESWVDEYQDMIDRVEETLEGNLFDSSLTKEIMDQVLENEGMSLDPDSHQYRQLAQVALKSTSAALENQQKRLMGEFDPQSKSDVLLKAATPSGASETKSDDITLVLLIEKFISENEGSWKAKTLKKYRANLSVCAEIIGEEIQVS
jgi:hypothetical protein